MNNIVDIPNIEEIAEIEIHYGLIIVGTATLEGGTRVGDTLKIDTSKIQATASNTLPLDFKLEFKWYRDQQIIENENSLQYIIKDTDTGHKIKAEVISAEEGFEGIIGTNEIVVEQAPKEMEGE
jgi:hypothetical protein